MMKLDAVDVVVDVAGESFAGGWRRARQLGAALAFGSGLLLAGPVAALDGIDLSQPAEPAAEGECPRLIQIKYPFLECPSGQIGLSDHDATWENSRQLPRQFEWIEGNGYFGPPHNARERADE